MKHKYRLPDGWKAVMLGDIAKVTTGGTPDRAKAAYWGGSIPWVSTGEINFNVIQEPREHITQAGLEKSSAKLFPQGTLLIAMFGQGVTRGKVALLGIEAAFNQACSAITPTNGDNPRFLFHYLAHHYHRIRRLGQAGTQSNLNASLIRSIPFIEPPLREQVRIIEIADQWDSALSKISTLIEAKQELKKGLAQRLLTAKNRRWTRIRLREIFKPVTRKNTGGVERVLTASGTDGLIDQRDYFDRNVAGADITPYLLLKRGEFAYNRSRMKGFPFGAIKRLDRYDEGAVSTLYLGLSISRDDVSSEFFRHFFDAGTLNEQLRRIAQAGARAHGLLNVTTTDFLDMTVQLPPPDEQTKIAQILNTAERGEVVLKKILEAMRAEKRGLMQKLLTGQIRMKETRNGRA